RRSFAWARPNLLVRRDGTRLPLRGVQALAWSPDERWTALATARHVVLVPTRRLADPRARRLWLPIEARDLAWAPTAD
ncbi:MAG: elongator complex 1 family protein, partial [Actinomycetota bacterium]|nr:elongator complex 1 family protein [Actinomycetota bacterium]